MVNTLYPKPSLIGEFLTFSNLLNSVVVEYFKLVLELFLMVKKVDFKVLECHIQILYFLCLLKKIKAVRPLYDIGSSLILPDIIVFTGLHAAIWIAIMLSRLMN